MNDLSPVIIMFTLIVTAGATLYFFLKARHAERMAMIEKGNLDQSWKPFKSQSTSFIGIKIGMLFFGIGLGILAAFIIHRMLGGDQSALYPGLMFLFGGGSLVLSYFVELRFNREEKL